MAKFSPKGVLSIPHFTFAIKNKAPNFHFFHAKMSHSLHVGHLLSRPQWPSLEQLILLTRVAQIDTIVYRVHPHQLFPSYRYYQSDVFARWWIGSWTFFVFWDAGELLRGYCPILAECIVGLCVGKSYCYLPRDLLLSDSSRRSFSQMNWRWSWNRFNNVKSLYEVKLLLA